MDERVKRALQQWPNVPDVYGWLALDRHGQWLLRGETITHPNVTAFINRNYARQADGGYAFQNGPQKVHVALALTPYIAHLSPTGDWTLHTGEPLGMADAVWLDAQGQLILQRGADRAALDDRDLLAALAWVRGRDGAALDDTELERALTDAEPAAYLTVGGQTLRLGFLEKDTSLGERFGFIARPES